MVNRSTAGKVENANARGKCMANMMSRQEMQMLIAIRTSTNPVGNGVIIMNMMAITTKAPTTSERCIAATASLFNRPMM